MNGCRPTAQRYDIQEATMHGFVKKKTGRHPCKKCNEHMLFLENINKKVMDLVKEMQSPCVTRSYI